MPRRHRPELDLVVPVLNEAADLERSVRRLRAWLDVETDFHTAIVIVDNGSTDATPSIAERLSRTVPGVSWMRLDQRGRGRALRAAWMRSHADYVGYTDVDLSTDLMALPQLLRLLVAGRADIAVGSRLAPGARVRRGPRREVISRVYNRLLKVSLGAGFRDAQCGFKVMPTTTAQRLLPQVEDEGWFFDTELLVRAERAGLRVVEVPVHWIEDTDSRVRILAAAVEDLRGIRRLRRQLTHVPTRGKQAAHRAHW